MRFNKGADSYRAYRLPWVGHPTDRPALAVKRENGDDVTAWASWNGATQVRRWALLAGPDAAHLRRIAVAARNGFETAIDAHTKAPRLAVQALDAAGHVLGTSRSR